MDAITIIPTITAENNPRRSVHIPYKLNPTTSVHTVPLHYEELLPFFYHYRV